MDYLKDFTIHFVGLSIGNHQFEFEVNDTFFEQFEYSELQHGLVKVLVDLEKQDRMLVFLFHLNGNVEVTCARCGEELLFPLTGNEHLIVKFGEEYKEESEDMIILPATDFKIDLSSFIYEFLHLLLPTRIIHPDDADGKTTCNPDVLCRLEELTPHAVIDPRWEALGLLKSNEPDLMNTSNNRKNNKTNN